MCSKENEKRRFQHFSLEGQGRGEVVCREGTASSPESPFPTPSCGTGSASPCLASPRGTLYAVGGLAPPQCGSGGGGEASVPAGREGRRRGARGVLTLQPYCRASLLRLSSSASSRRSSTTPPAPGRRGGWAPFFWRSWPRGRRATRGGSSSEESPEPPPPLSNVYTWLVGVLQTRAGPWKGFVSAPFCLMVLN